MAASLTLKLLLRNGQFQKELKKSEKDFAAFSKRVTGDARGFKKLGVELKNFGVKMTKSLTLPLGVFSGFAVSAFRSFEKELLQVKAVTKGTIVEFEKLEKQAKSLGKQTKFSATEAAEGMGFLGQAGFNATEIFEAMPSILDLAAAANLSVAESADIASNILAGYGLETENLAEANDILTKAFTSSNTNLLQLGEAMKKAGPFAKEMGLEFSEVAAILGTMGNAGIQAEEAGTALNRALVNLAVPTGETKKVIEEFGLQVRDTGGQMKPFADILEEIEKKGLRAEDVIRLFGVRAGPKLLKVVRDGSQALRDYSSVLKDSVGESARVAADKMKGLDGELTRLTSSFKGLLIDVGSALAPFIIKASEQIRELIKSFSEMDESTQAWVSGTVIALAVGGPLIVGLVFLTKTIASVVLAVKAMNTAMLLNPAVLVFGAAASVVAGLLALTLKLTGQFELFGEIGKGFKSAFSETFSFIKDQFKSLTAVFGEESKKISKIADQELKAGIVFAMIDITKVVKKSTIEQEKSWLIYFDQITKEFKRSAQEMDGHLIQGTATTKREEEKRLRIQKQIGDELGRYQKQKGREILSNAQNTYKAQTEIVELGAEAQKLAAQGVATVLKSIWSDQETTFEDAWKNSLNVFVDVLVQMLVQTKFTAIAISAQMALMTAGITLVIGLLASVFGGKKKGKSALQKATESFLSEIKRSLISFEDEVLSSLEKITKTSEKGREQLTSLLEAASIFNELRIASSEFDNFVGGRQGKDLQQRLRNLGIIKQNETLGDLEDRARRLRKRIVDNASESIKLVEKEFQVKKAAINEIFNLIKREKDFLKDVGKSITSVEQAFFTPEELFDAQKKQIQDLQSLVAGSTGEDKLDFANELKQSLLDSFETAKTVFENDKGLLKAYQQTVINGLKGVQGSGKDAFKDLVDIQVEILGIDKEKLITQKSMELHLSSLTKATAKILNIFTSIGNTSGILSNQQISDLSRSASVLGFANGGIVTRPTLAMIGEAGEREAIVPLSKASQFGFGGGGGNTYVINTYVQDIGQLTPAKAESLIKGSFHKAGEKLDREGYRSPIQPRPVRR